MIDVLNGKTLNINCLDKGYVRLVDCMPRLSPTGIADYAIVEAARRSYDQGIKTEKEDISTLRYMARHRHTSPTEMVEFKFHIKCPMCIGEQILRTRTANINKLSGRYAELQEEFHFPEHDEVREQSKSNKQGSEGYLQARESANFITALHINSEESYDRYKTSIDEGVAKEQARMLLPANIYTDFYWKIDLHNLLHTLALRCDPHAQKEYRVYANAILELIKPIVPWSIQAWEDYHPMRGAMLLTRLEVEALHHSILTRDFRLNPFSDGSITGVQIESDNKREQNEWKEKAAKLGIKI